MRFYLPGTSTENLLSYLKKKIISVYTAMTKKKSGSYLILMSILHEEAR